MSPWREGRGPFAAIALLCAAAVALALYTQHGLGMMPCPWCVLQRLVFVVIALVVLPAALLPQRGLRKGGALLAATLAVAGIAAALYQHFVAAASASCNLTLADRILSASGLDEAWPQVFAPWASCADAAVRLFGVPYEFYSLALFVAVALAAAWLLRGR
ncbi:MAG TPA: disulfide bond formation protein B [Rubrivivax sp.]|nr:disulfide bond formation protein B [Rubrivivax sp.]